MQDDLFGSPPDPIPPSPPISGAHPPGTRAPRPRVRPAEVDASIHSLAASLPPTLHLGTSSWSYPGWAGLVWDGEVAEATLSRHGLSAYAAHPLLRTVSIDRSFYRALDAGQYAHYASQVPSAFRFIVKAPGSVADAMVRSETGKGLQPNPLFLDSQWAIDEFIRPAMTGLGPKIGALVFQLSPLPADMLRHVPQVLARLDAMLGALPRVQEVAPDGVVALEVRDPALLGPALVEVLKRRGVAYCLGLHAKMPPVEAQLPMLRAMWPGPLVCRWNLHRRHGPFGYEDAQKQYAPYDRLHDPDHETRAVLAKVIAGTVGHGQRAYISVSNKAEGCSPLTVQALAEAVRARLLASRPQAEVDKGHTPSSS